MFSDALSESAVADYLPCYRRVMASHVESWTHPAGKTVDLYTCLKKVIAPLLVY